MGQVESMLDSFDEVDRKEVLNYDLTIRGVCNKIKSYDIRKIVVLAGAGLSTAAGIPDFRTPGTGLYSNLQKYKLPKPECMFDIDYFHDNPNPFYIFANELLPGKYYPTLGHYFLCLLEKKGVLQRVYTQNIDMLERLAGLNPEKLVECHGNFATSHCIKCHKKYDSKIVEDSIKEQKIAYCTDEKCKGILKPGIIFFGETLPERFKWLTSTDMMSADLLIIIGTSLNVEPCASLVYQVGDLCPRLLINLEAVGPFKDYKNPRNYRDVFVKDSIDNAVMSFCKEMGWEKDLLRIQQKKTRQLDYEYHPERVPSAFQSFVNVLKTLSPFSPRTDDDYLSNSNNDNTSAELPYYNNNNNNKTPKSASLSSPLRNETESKDEENADEKIRGCSITSITSSVISTSPTENNNSTLTASIAATTTTTTTTTTSSNKMPMYIQSVE